MNPSKLFHETDPLVLINRIKDHPLGLLVAVSKDGNPQVTHAPILIETRAKEIFISFHLARNNTICKTLLDSHKCLCIFTGPNAYISPDWYETPDQVPTWNYLSVECEGIVRELGINELIKQLDGLSKQSEQQLLPKPMWTRSKMKDGKFEALLRAIVGFEMKVDVLKGTTKISQNKPISMRKKIVKKLKNNPIVDAMIALDN